MKGENRRSQTKRHLLHPESFKSVVARDTREKQPLEVSDNPRERILRFARYGQH